jgi:hypothetical protein
VNEREKMERWERRLRFFRRSVILDLVCPIVGVVGLVWLFVTGSESYAAWLACGGAIGLPGVGVLAELASRRQP